MKTILFCTLFLSACCTQIFAQSSGALWVGNRTSDSQANAIIQALSGAYDAFIAGDLDKGFAVYSDDASEIGPDGSLVHGIKTLRQGFDDLQKVVDEKPNFKYSNIQVRILTNDVALAIWESEADIKIGGQQVGGKTRDMAVLQKINGQWKIVFDQLTPIMPPPGN